ncbi:histone H1oo [Otolemur garnettii]|uniref:histone H1oo n=1 Tax=Otolemur garnettii TaxID=30611 RepID=UPI0002741877|nr:histone H1oo [Otolemur garnettii]
MAPGSVTSETSTTSTSTAGSSSSESEKPGHSTFLVGRRNPPVLRMVLEALQAGEQRRGTSVVAIKLYILNKYPTVDVTRFKYLLKQALATGMRRGLLTRPLNSKAKGATGSFKLVPKHKKKVQSRRTAASRTPRRTGEAKEKGPKKPNEAKKDPLSLGEVEKAARKPGKVRKPPPKPHAAKEKDLRNGSKATDVKAKLGEARKAPPKPDKATQVPSKASRLSEKSKVNGRSSQGDDQAHRKTKVSSKPTASKVKNEAASPTKKKMTAKAPQGAAAQRSREKPNARAASPAKGTGSKTATAHLARKTEGPVGSRRPGLPIKASASKVSSKKAEA